MKLSYIFEGGSGAPMNPATTEMARYLMDHPNQVCESDAIAEACGFAVRSIRTIASWIRRSLGEHSNRLMSSAKHGYAWIGEPFEIVACVQPLQGERCKPVLSNYAVVPADVVAKRLGITQAEVLDIEKTALAKLAEHPMLKKAWQEILESRGRLHFDPLYEIWLFSVVDGITYAPIEEAEKDVDEI